MSNIAGKAYAMNVITPVTGWVYYWNRFTMAALQFAVNAKSGDVGFFGKLVPSFIINWIYNRLGGLITLSLIHYARWAIIKRFPHLDANQPKERLKYHYMMFFSNFNGSWDQYVDSFHMAIPSGLNLAWFKNVQYPKSVPLQPFHRYITYNQIWTNHYYNAYPLASSNDVKGSQALKDALSEFITASAVDDAAQFKERFEALLLAQQENLGLMEATPIVSLSADAVLQREEGISHG